MPIERGQIPMRAPITSSTNEALKKSRGQLEQMIAEAIQSNLAGFRGNYVSSVAVRNLQKQSGMRVSAPRTVTNALEALGYHNIGRAVRPYAAEDLNLFAQIFHTNKQANVEDFGKWQSYE
jgi:hypothetical protein